MRLVSFISFTIMAHLVVLVAAIGALATCAYLVAMILGLVRRDPLRAETSKLRAPKSMVPLLFRYSKECLAMSGPVLIALGLVLGIFYLAVSLWRIIVQQIRMIAKFPNRTLPKYAKESAQWVFKVMTFGVSVDLPLC